MKVLEVPHLIRDISWLLLGPSTHPTAGLQRKELQDVTAVTWLRHITPRGHITPRTGTGTSCTGTGSSPTQQPCIPTQCSCSLRLKFMAPMLSLRKEGRSSMQRSCGHFLECLWPPSYGTRSSAVIWRALALNLTLDPCVANRTVSHTQHNVRSHVDDVL
jgi:hypothetical protein